MVYDPFEPTVHSELSKMPMPQITKDGVTVARQVKSLKDRVESIGCKLLIDASERTNEESGDGTTSSTVIASCILEKG